MQKLFQVLRQEYLLKVRTRAFLFGTFILPILMAALMILPGYFMNVSLTKPSTIAVVDRSGLLLSPLERNLTGKTPDGQRLYNLVREDPAGRSDEEIVRDLGPRILKKEVSGLLVLPANPDTGGLGAFYAENVSDPMRNETLENAMTKTIRELRLRSSGLDTVRVATVLRGVSMTTYKVKEGGVASRDRVTTFLLAYLIGFIFYFALIIYGAMMLRAALEEKTSRSAEAMVSVVRPTTLMGGKILGIGLTALTQMGIWAAILGFVVLYLVSNNASVLGGIDLSAVSLSFPTLLLFLLFFILGFFLYAGAFAALGSMVNSESEAQQLQMTLNLPAVVAFLLMFMAIRDPNATVVRICSAIPFFSPILMPVRACVIMPPAWEIILSLALLVAGIAGMIWVAGRIFRVGLLMYGKRPNLPELMKWIRQG